MMRAAALLLIALVAGAASATEPVCAGATEALFEQARDDYRAGRFEPALRHATRLAWCYPDNVDYLYQRSLALAALGRDAEAAAVATRATALAPDYEELTAFAHRIRTRADAARAKERELAAARAAAEAEEQARAIAAARPEPSRWLANAWVAAHALTGGRDGWNDLALGLRRSRGALDAGGLVEVARRGEARDVSITGDTVWTVTQGTRLTARLGLTPGATFRPEVLAAVGAEHDLDGGWVLRGELAQRRFDSARATNATVGADLYVADFRLAAGLTTSRLSGAGNALGGVASVDWYASDTHRYRVTASLGDELDTIEANNTVLETRVRAITLAGEHGLRQGLSLGWWVGTIEQGRFYDRRYAGLSVTRRY